MRGGESTDALAILSVIGVRRELCQMNITQLQGRLARLTRELAIAYSSLPWNGAWIERLTRDVAETEGAIAAQQKVESKSSVERVAELVR